MYLECPLSLIAAGGVTVWWDWREIIFCRLKQTNNVKRSSLSHCRRRAHIYMDSCLNVWLLVSSDRRLILCRYRQHRILGWVVRSLNWQRKQLLIWKIIHFAYIFFLSNFICIFFTSIDWWSINLIMSLFIKVLIKQSRTLKNLIII